MIKWRNATTEDIINMSGFSLPGRLAAKDAQYQKHQAQQRASARDEPSTVIRKSRPKTKP